MRLEERGGLGQRGKEGPRRGGQSRKEVSREQKVPHGLGGAGREQRGRGGRGLKCCWKVERERQGRLCGAARVNETSAAGN